MNIWTILRVVILFFMCYNGFTMKNERLFEFTHCTSPITNRKETDLRLIGVGYVDLMTESAERFVRIQPYYTIHYVITGKGYLEFNGTKYEITANEIFALPNKIPFRYYSDEDDPWAYAFFEFNGALAKSYIEEAGFSLDKPVQKCPAPQQIRSSFKDYFEKQHKTHEVSYHETMSVFSMLLGTLSKNENKVFMYDDAFISNIKSFVKLRFIDPDFSVEYIAKEFHISHSYLCKIFKKNTGGTLISYINKQKMRYAEDLLLTTDYTILQISSMTGFRCYPRFLSLFKQLHGQTATEYRKINATPKRVEGGNA